MSSTSSSRVRIRRIEFSPSSMPPSGGRPNLAALQRLVSVSRRRRRRPARTRPGSGGPTRAGARCTRAGCSPSSRNRSSPSSSARTRCALRCTASIAGLASVAASTYHWSVSKGSIGTPQRSPCGTMWRVARSSRGAASSSIISTTLLARLEAVETVERVHRGDQLRRRVEAVEEIRVAVERRSPLRRQHVDHRQVVALADLEIVEVVRRRDLHRARALLGVGIFVGDDRDAPARRAAASRACRPGPVALVVGMHGDGGVAQHRLGPGGRDGDVALRIVGIEDRVLERIAEVPELPSTSRCSTSRSEIAVMQLRVPVDQPLVLVDQALPCRA